MNRTKFALAAMGALTFLVAGTGVTYAANGGSFILGHTNTESRTSVLSTSGSHAALSLKTQSSQTPPLAVSNSTKVARLNADLLDGLSSGDLQRRVAGTCAAGQAVRAVAAGGGVTCTTPFSRIVVVHPGSTPTASGNALIAVLSALTGSASAPSLVFVEPGDYDLGNHSLVMQSYVSVVGSGPGVTTVQAETADTSPFNGVTAATGTLADMTILASTTVNAGVVNGVELASGVLTMRNLEIQVDGLDAAAGLRLDGGQMQARDLTVSSPDVGLSNVGGKAVIWGSTLSGAVDAVSQTASHESDIAGSMVAGAVSGGTTLCAGDFNLNYVPLSGSCA